MHTFLVSSASNISVKNCRYGHLRFHATSIVSLQRFAVFFEPKILFLECGFNCLGTFLLDKWKSHSSIWSWLYRDPARWTPVVS